MTGFGRGSAGKGPNKIDVEIRTVNSRFLETKIRGFNLDPILELKVRNTLETSLQRGNVQVRFELKSSQDSQKLSFNRKRFEILQDVVKKIHVDYGQRMNLSDKFWVREFEKRITEISMEKKHYLKIYLVYSLVIAYQLKVKKKIITNIGRQPKK